jgi:hypothetical protein
MAQALKQHPSSRGLAVGHIEVDLARPKPRSLVLSCTVTGNIGDLNLPAVAAAARSDELWRHTCFEAFLQTSPGGAYFEFNFAPSTRWAAYRFDGYRSGMLAAEIDAPQIEVRSEPTRFILRAALELDRLLGPPSDATWHLGISAVIEETSGNISYWALAHPPGKADFHHSDCFAHELAWRP